MGDNKSGRGDDKQNSVSVHFKPTVWFYLLREMRENIPDCTKMFHGYVVGTVGDKEMEYDCRLENNIWLN